MAKKQNQPTRTKLEEFNDSLSGIEQKFEKNKKNIYIIGGCILAVALLVWGYFFFIAGPNRTKAAEQVNKGFAQAMLEQNDSLALETWSKVAKNYSNDEANLARLNAAIVLYKQAEEETDSVKAAKKIDQAIKYIESYDPEGTVIGPASQNLMANCYVNKGQAYYDKAIEAYDRAIKLSGDNEDYTPYFMFKKAQVLSNLKTPKFDEAIKVYEEMKQRYPNFADQAQVDKYLERVKAQKGAK